MTTPRLTPPGPSYVVEEQVRLRGAIDSGGRRLRAGMTTPSVTDDGWWLAHLWIADAEGVIDTLDIAPAAGPPPGAPLDALGPRIAGSLSGLIDQEAGRQLIRLRMPPPDNEQRPWARPLLCMLAVRWDPVRAAVMSREELARDLLVGFAAAVEAVGRPG